jgi:hypothetical protein
MKNYIRERYSYIKEKIGFKRFFKSLGSSTFLYFWDIPLRTLGYASTAALYFFKPDFEYANLPELIVAYSGLRLGLSYVEKKIVEKQQKEGKQIITPDTWSSSLGILVERPEHGPWIKGAFDTGKQIFLYLFLRPLFFANFPTDFGLTVFRAGKDGLIILKEYAYKKSK